MQLHEAKTKSIKRFSQNICLWFLAIGFVLMNSYCKKLVETEPPSGSLSDVTVYSSDATAIAAINGIYINMNAAPFQGRNSVGLLAGLSADELTLYSGVTDANFLGYYYNALSQTSGVVPSGTDSWSPLYYSIHQCNAALEKLETTNSLTNSIKSQLIGEVKFLRAFFYFYLVNLFGDVPLVLTTDSETNISLARSSQAEVYQQIISDLIESEANLSKSFLNGTLVSISDERVRPTKWAAKALLARVYLYLKEWEKAEAIATAVIDNKVLFDLVPLNDVFVKNSKEAIWQLQPTEINYNTIDAQVLIIPQTGPNASNNSFVVSDFLLNSFETDDLRSKYGNWVDTTIYKLTSSLNDTAVYVNKYKLNLKDSTITSTTGITNMKEYFMMLRLGEQYLIRAEARAELGNLSGSIEDLNTIRGRAFSPAKPTTATDKTSLLIAIFNERQVELFAEWGHRWLDLKRTNKVNEIMSDVTPRKANGASWQSYQQWYPLPRVTDLERAMNLVQNEGY
jgi:hypothetical protein